MSFTFRMMGLYLPSEAKSDNFSRAVLKSSIINTKAMAAEIQSQLSRLTLRMIPAMTAQRAAII